MPLIKRCVAEFIGTFWLVLGGCDSTTIAASSFTADTARLGEGTAFPLGIGLVGVSLAFGLTVLTIAYALGHIIACHLNPAVSFGLWAGKRFTGSELLPYILAQVVGEIAATGVVYLIASGREGFVLTGSKPLATNGFGAHPPSGYSLLACFVTGVVMTFMFLIVILGALPRDSLRLQLVWH